MGRPRFLYVPFWLTYVFLYAPIAVLVVMSFNEGKSPYLHEGFSLKWYGVLAEDDKVMEGLVNTLIVAGDRPCSPRSSAPCSPWAWPGTPAPSCSTRSG
ncbi:ABC transporter permease [Nonomuraea recticatena]|uniref:ABC transporter permease n=1 Tax=Nonomuraea recticatena TaxID=46178 RepID=UPI00361BD822